jgi:hypothetical protein
MRNKKKEKRKKKKQKTKNKKQKMYHSAFFLVPFFQGKYMF